MCKEALLPTKSIFATNASSKAGLHNVRPAGRMRPAKAFLVTGESCLNCSKCCKRPTSGINNCRSRILSKLYSGP